MPEHAFKDYVCHTHQCLASECGCLEDERARRCPHCGLVGFILSRQKYCPNMDCDSWSPVIKENVDVTYNYSDTDHVQQ
jgi:hypothetical protein